jgi:hypothetical protein
MTQSVSEPGQSATEGLRMPFEGTGRSGGVRPRGRKGTTGVGMGITKSRARTFDAGPGAFPRAGSRGGARELSMTAWGLQTQVSGSCHRIGLEGA